MGLTRIHIAASRKRERELVTETGDENHDPNGENGDGSWVKIPHIRPRTALPFQDRENQAEGNASIPMSHVVRSDISLNGGASNEIGKLPISDATGRTRRR